MLDIAAPSTNGMSSETLLFEVRWEDGGKARSQHCAARLAPDPAAMPVFPLYDLERQFRVMQLVDERTAVPVPRTLWYEGDAAVLGSPFFVMARVDGEVPPDIMPYTFGSWLTEASTADRARLQQSSVGVLAAIHKMDASAEDTAFLELDRPGASALRRHVADQRVYYDWVVADGLRSPLIERGFAWLADHWPTNESDPTVSWGDARIGNILYRDFEPVAVLDWEMAAVGPPEIDLGWMIYLHRFFQDLTEGFGLPGLPDFMRREEVAETYTSLAGHEPRDLTFYTLYAALRHGIIMARIGRRSIHFGEAEMPDDVDDLITHRSTIERMLDGTYWDGISQ